MRVIVFDTETIGQVSQKLLNVGYKIVDICIQKGTAKVLCERNYLVGSIYKNSLWMLNDSFVGQKKYESYQKMVESKTIVCREIGAIFQQMEKDIKRHGVLFGYAFNSAFDLDKFDRTAQEEKIDNPLCGVPVFDLWGYAYNYITITDEYKEWAIANGQLTQSQRYISGNVESIVRFLSNDLDFVESHTALDDVGNELNILLECVKRGADITMPMKKGNVLSGKVFKEILKMKDGTTVEVKYTKAIEKDGIRYLYE